jgi:hypothetical protein
LVSCRERRHPAGSIRRAAIAFLLSSLASRVPAATAPQEAPLELLPPHSELPPTFWEQYGAIVVIAVVAAVIVGGFGIWLLLRPRPKAPVPPEAEARAALNALKGQPEDGDALSRVSQILRRYIITAFKLPPGEPTTTEFQRALAKNEDVGAELSNAVSEFLRRCDEQKFSPHGGGANSVTIVTTFIHPAGAVARALELVDLGESRRAELQRAREQQLQHPSRP